MNASLEVAAVFRDGEPGFRAHYGQMLSPVSNVGLRVPSSAAARRPWAAMCNAAATAATSRFNTTRAATGTAPSARPWPVPPGSRSGKANCCPYRTFTSCSRCRTNWRPWPCRTNESSTASCSRLPPKRCWKSPPIPQHLGARVGCLMVLHTWGQNLMHHPHVHAIVTGGGLSPDGSRWIDGKTQQTPPAVLRPGAKFSAVSSGASSSPC